MAATTKDSLRQLVADGGGLSKPKVKTKQSEMCFYYIIGF